jgi:hypothetical protein
MSIAESVVNSHIRPCERDGTSAWCSTHESRMGLLPTARCSKYMDALDLAEEVEERVRERIAREIAADRDQVSALMEAAGECIGLNRALRIARGEK